MSLGGSFIVGAVAAACRGCLDFHRPHPPQALRTMVTWRRYLLALSVYAGFWALLFALLERTFVAAASGVANAPATAASIALALLAVIVLPYVPGVNTMLEVARGLAQQLALFPMGRDALQTVLGRAPSTEAPITGLAREQVREDLSDHIEDLPTAQAVVSPLMMTVLGETAGIRLVLDAQRKVHPRFFRARAAAVQDADHAYARTLRRAGQLAFVLDEVTEEAGDSAGGILARRLPGLLADEALAALNAYRSLLADLALSQIDDSAARGAFLQQCGYAVPNRIQFPFWPILGAFAAVFAVLLLPALLPGLLPDPTAPQPVLVLPGWLVAGLIAAVSLGFTAYLAAAADGPVSQRFHGFPFWPVAAWLALAYVAMLAPVFLDSLRRPVAFPRMDGVNRLLLFVSAVAQATVQALAIAWAIGPKTVSGAAWPSLRVPAWRSWVTYSAVSYGSGVVTTVIVGALFPNLPIMLWGSRGVLAVSLFSPVVTFGVAALVDRYLMTRQLFGWRGRIADGGALAALLALTDIAIQHWITLPSWTPFLTGFYALIGFVIGLMVPAQAASGLLRDAALRRGSDPLTAVPPDAAPRRVGSAVLPSLSEAGKP